jgi:hypothetical protein
MRGKPIKERSLLQRKLVELIGKEATKRLITAFGGTRLYIPTPNRLRPTNRLVQAIGWDSAMILCREYGGVSHLKIPTCHVYRKPLDRRKIVRLRAKAIPISHIAKKVHCTEKAIYEHLKKAIKELRNSRNYDWIYWA